MHNSAMFCTESVRPSAIYPPFISILPGTRRCASAANGDCVLRLGPEDYGYRCCALCFGSFTGSLVPCIHPSKTSNFRTFLNLIAGITNWTLSVTLNKTSCCFNSANSLSVEYIKCPSKVVRFSSFCPPKAVGAARSLLSNTSG